MFSRLAKKQHAEPCVLDDFPNRLKDGPNVTWHSVSAAGPDRFKMSAPRKSDELGIIEEVGDLQNAETERPAMISMVNWIWVNLT
jgi:hypothetical protein